MTSSLLRRATAIALLVLLAASPFGGLRAEAQAASGPTDVNYGNILDYSASDVLLSQGGFAYAYVRVGTKYTLSNIFYPANAQDQFGAAVAVSPSGNVVAVGNQINLSATQQTPGVVYIYERAGLAYLPKAPVLTGSNGNGAYFGAALALTEVS